LATVPVFIENQQKGGYKLYLDPGDYGGDMIIKFNLSYEADPEIAKWMNTADFRRALAIRIDRHPLNEPVRPGAGGVSAPPAPRSRRRSGSGPACRAPRCPPTATSTTPALSTGRCGRRST